MSPKQAVDDLLGSLSLALDRGSQSLGRHGHHTRAPGRGRQGEEPAQASRMFRTGPGAEGKGSGAAARRAPDRWVRPVCPRASRTASHLSESSVRIFFPNSPSVSALRVRRPGPLSESSVRIHFPSPPSESSVRVLCPSPLGRGISVGLGTGPGLFQTVCRLVYFQTCLSLPFVGDFSDSDSLKIDQGQGLRTQTVCRLRARPDILAWYTNSKKLSIQGNKLYTVSDVIEKCKTQSSPAMNGRRV